MRQSVILLILGLVLAFIAFQARTGIFRRANPGEPANKYMRQIMENPQLSAEDAAILRERYGNAHLNLSGLRYIERHPGTGPTPATGSEVVVHYATTGIDAPQEFKTIYARHFQICKNHAGSEQGQFFQRVLPITGSFGLEAPGAHNTG